MISADMLDETNTMWATARSSATAGRNRSRGRGFSDLAGPKARVLILENHDDFGGHARRNEYHVGNRTIIGYGGTQSIAGPSLYRSGRAKSAGADPGESR